MGVEQSHIIIVGHLFDYKTFMELAREKLGSNFYEKIMEPFSFHNFKSYHKQNMDGNLKCLDTSTISYMLLEKNIRYYPVHDAGRTQVEPGSLTCMAVEPLEEDPLEEDLCNELFGNLKLL